MTLVDALEQAADEKRFGLRFLDRRERESFFSWSELYARARRTAGQIQALGVAPGDRVALILPTGVGFFDAFFGAWLAGAVPVPMYPPLRLGRMEAYEERTAGMLARVDAQVLLTDDTVWKVLGPTLERAALPLRGHRLSTLSDGPFVPQPATEAGLGLIQFSSGTTGDPKGVGLSHRALLAQADMLIDAIVAAYPEDPEHPWSGCSWLPLYHDMGLIGAVFVALRRMRDLTLIAPQDFLMQPALWLKAMSRSKALISPAPNFAFGYCVARIRDEELSGVDLSHWRMALNGAEPVSPDTLRAFLDRFAPWGLREDALVPVYGLSEAALAVTFSDPTRAHHGVRFHREALVEGRAVPDADGMELVGVGRPLPGVSMRCVDDDGDTVPSGRVGHLQIRSPSLMDGYIGCADATERTLREGWLDTGDLAVTLDGEWYILGRSKDVIIVGGRNYAAHDLEHAVDSVVGVRTGCAAAAGFMPEGADRETVVLMVEHDKRATPEQRESMPSACAEAILARVGIRVDHVVVLAPGTIPRTTSGKIRRREAVRQLQAGELAPPDQVNALHMAGLLARSGLAHVRVWAKRQLTRTG